jgi:outer membrane protein OmpA-like peptidoglycan-associated protein
MMRPGNIRDICLLGALMMFAALAAPARAQAPVTADDMINRLGGLETAPDLDIAALRQRALDRVKSKTEPVALKRPRIAPELLKLPQLLVEVQFDPDSAIVRPQSYQTLGLIADALVRAAMLPYGFLIVGRTEAAGKREYNLTLSQRRADSIRDVLVTTFKISPKRIQAIGLGEEQLQDANQPASLVNRQIQIVTIAKAP